jgi:hypothetical protein
MIALFITSAAAALTAAHGYTDAALKDQVVNLPGSENIDITFNQFSGYLAVNSTKQLHYWLVESMNDPVSVKFSRKKRNLYVNVVCRLLIRSRFGQMVGCSLHMNIISTLLNIYCMLC